mgnify:CR=1 FL=1
MFMFSASYGYAWGCRCCTAKTQYHNNWSIYSVDSKNTMRTTPRPTLRMQGNRSPARQLRQILRACLTARHCAPSPDKCQHFRQRVASA